MKLVEFDDNNLSSSKIEYSDEQYRAPRVLQHLDKEMGQILQMSNLSDTEKLSFYNQVLRRYLVFVNQARHIHQAKSKEEDENDHLQQSLLFNESGCTRDSIDAISQPSVKKFFESLRDASMNDGSAQNTLFPLSSTQQGIPQQTSFQRSPIQSTTTDNQSFHTPDIDVSMTSQPSTSVIRPPLIRPAVLSTLEDSQSSLKKKDKQKRKRNETPYSSRESRSKTARIEQGNATLVRTLTTPMSVKLDRLANWETCRLPK